MTCRAVGPAQAVAVFQQPAWSNAATADETSATGWDKFLGKFGNRTAALLEEAEKLLDRAARITQRVLTDIACAIAAGGVDIEAPQAEVFGPVASDTTALRALGDVTPGLLPTPHPTRWP